MGFTGLYVVFFFFFLFLLKNIDCVYSLEPPRRKLSEFLSENFQFLVVNFLIYLNRRVFVMGLTWVSSYSYFYKKFQGGLSVAVVLCSFVGGV